MEAKVAIVMGSVSDRDRIEGTFRTLRELGISWEARVLSAHRTPDLAAEFAREAEGRGLRVIIAAAGGAAHLAGAMAANTLLPVIGIPLAATSLNGWDALLATAQMPGGIPVATVAVGDMGAVNAAILAAQILALSDPDLSLRLRLNRDRMRAKVTEADARMREGDMS